MLNDFLTCPAAFYKRHILNEAESGTSSALHFGTALHLAINQILEGEDGLESFMMYWDSLKDKDMIYYRHGWQELRGLATEKFLPNFIRLHSKKFSNFKQEETLTMPFLGEHTFQGTYDFCGDYEGVLTLTDWKTTTNDYKFSKLEKNPQLYMYSKLYQHKYGVLPKQIMYKTFVKTKGSIQTLKLELTEEHLNSIVRNVEHTAKAMLHLISTKEVYHGADCYCKGVS